MYEGYFSKETKKRVFLSFASEDLDHVRGLRLLKDNPKFELDFYDESIKESIDSKNSEYIKRVIREQIQRSSVTIALLSETTYKSDWVNWELEESEKQGNKIVAMAVKDVTTLAYPKYIKDNKIDVWIWDLNKLIELLS